MQAVILAAGRGTRMGDLTSNVPKALLEISGKSLIEYKLDALPEEVGEVIIVIGYLGGLIQRKFGDSYGKIRILYVEEEDPVAGTAHSLWKARDLLKDRFLVMNGDNIYAREDMQECMKYEWAVLVKKSESIKTGTIIVDESGRVIGAEENTEHSGGPGYANTGLYVLDRKIFDYSPIPKSRGSKELGLPQTIVKAAKNVAIQAVLATFWLEIKSPEDLENSSKVLENMAN